MYFKICLWNVAGKRSIIKKKDFDYLRREDADIIALQEIKCQEHKLPNEAKFNKHFCYYFLSNKPGYSSVALLSKTKLIRLMYGMEEDGYNDEGRLITAVYNNFYLLNVSIALTQEKD